MSVNEKLCCMQNTTVLLLDHSKMGVRNYYQVFTLADIDILITDAPLPEELRQKCEREDVEVIVCG